MNHTLAANGARLPDQSGLQPGGVSDPQRAPEPSRAPKALPIGNTRLKLDACERRIKSSLNTVTLMSVKVGEELDLIRSERLYEDDFDTFQEYCWEQWSWSASRVRQHIAAARTARSLALPNGALPIGITNERQLRALNVLPPAHRLEALTEAINAWTATGPRGKEMPARHVEQIARRTAAALGLNVLVNGNDLSTMPEALPIGNAPETVPASVSPVIPSPVVPLRPKETRESRLIQKADRTIADLRDLLAECGTPDSEAAAELQPALDRVEKFREHQTMLENLQSSRPT